MAALARFPPDRRRWFKVQALQNLTHNTYDEYRRYLARSGTSSLSGFELPPEDLSRLLRQAVNATSFADLGLD
jgi:hypothetical protein